MYFKLNKEQMTLSTLIKFSVAVGTKHITSQYDHIRKANKRLKKKRKKKLVLLFAQRMEIISQCPQNIQTRVGLNSSKTENGELTNTYA